MNGKVTGKIMRGEEEIYIEVIGDIVSYTPGIAEEYVKIRDKVVKVEED